LIRVWPQRQVGSDFLLDQSQIPRLIGSSFPIL
jgi:hypothetical protein